MPRGQLQDHFGCDVGSKSKRVGSGRWSIVAAISIDSPLRLPVLSVRIDDLSRQSVVIISKSLTRSRPVTRQ
jgi:hypothetical protein